MNHDDFSFCTFMHANIIPSQSSHRMSIFQVRIIDVFRDTIRQKCPVILAAPLLQKCKSLGLINRHPEAVGVGIVIYERLLRTEFAHNGQHIVPVSAVAPSLYACVLDLGVQDCRDMDQRQVLCVRVEGCIESS